MGKIIKIKYYLEDRNFKDQYVFSVLFGPGTEEAEVSVEGIYVPKQSAGPYGEPEELAYITDLSVIASDKYCITELLTDNTIERLVESLFEASEECCEE